MIMVEAMNEDVCLRTMLETSRRTVYQTLFRIYQHYFHGSSQDAIREWFSLLGISVESGLHLNEGNLVLPAFDFSSVVQGMCDNPDCSSPEERYNHVNIVLPWRFRECDRQHTCILQNRINHWFHTTEQCNASYRPNNPENFNATNSGSGTCTTTTCGGTRDRTRCLSSNDLPLVLPINIQGMQFSSSDEIPMHVDFNGARFRLAGVTFLTQEDGVQQATSRIFGARRSFYHSGDSVHSDIPQEDPLNEVLSFVYYVIDTDAL
ncbi:uncharacterized protein LOC125650798 [Ostrea edulis]|uniref:uncharacterized protein LOC125650798 n=1 Tax=Ostrea edulis TaxID=37623 RepID=UPI0024AFB192|nr:uncharacterized protein LOC125650798 [Ostrea edulis]